MNKKWYWKLGAYILVIALIALASPLVMGQSLPKTGVAGSTHDVAGRGCNGCHAPHNGALANGGTSQTTGQILLWSRNFPNSTNTFGVYDSATMKNKAVELGGSALTTSTDVRMYSLLCLSCHDGVTSTFSPAMRTINMVGSRATFGAGAYESTGLTNDHPVNMTYDPTRNTALKPVATVTAALPLYGTNNTMQCATCHDPHNNVNTNYLRQANNTTHCTTCHL
jgi:predicted CXXCH cytochrome family protein